MRTDSCFSVPVAPGDVDKATATFARWRERGYRTAALWYGDSPPGNCDYPFRFAPRDYRGWPWAVNRLCALLKNDWVITGGADTYPDPNCTAAQLGAECNAHFGGTFGVMQPAGDKYGAIANKTAAVSPWIGREFILRTYGGHGPMCELYGHYFADGELMHVAEKLGCLWWRDDVTQYHDHYGRRGEPIPAHLERWQKDYADQNDLYIRRMAAGFPGYRV